MSKDRSKEILREIRELRTDLDSRIKRLEAAVGLPVEEQARVEEIELTETGDGAEVSAAEVDAGEALASGEAFVPSPVAPVAPAPLVRRPAGSRSVSVTVRPLVDLGLVRAVEVSLSNSDGVEEARLASLSGDAAVIDTRISPGASVIGALRESLPVAFDVVDSSENSVTIEMVTPENDEEAGIDPPETIQH